MPIQIKGSHKALANFIALFLVGNIGFIAMLYIFLQIAGLESGVGIPSGLTDVLKWMIVSSFGLASVCFSFYRTFDKEEELKIRIRGAGSRLLLSSILMLIALALAVVTETFNRIPGSVINPPPDQIIIPAIIAIIGFFFIFNVYWAIERLAEVLLAVMDSDGEASLSAPSGRDWSGERPAGETVTQGSLVDTPASKPDKTQGK